MPPGAGILGLADLVPLGASFLWKYRAVRGGSRIWSEVRAEALKRKRRQRRRLRDLLGDDLLRRQMMREFLEASSKEAAEARMRELEDLASREVTADDVSVTTDDALERIMSRIYLAFAAWTAAMLFAWSDLFVAHIGAFMVWVAVHLLDNRVNFGKFETMSTCFGAKPKFEEGEESTFVVSVV